MRRFLSRALIYFGRLAASRGLGAIARAKLKQPVALVEMENGAEVVGDMANVYRGDTAPSIVATIYDGDGNPIDLSTATLILFMGQPDGIDGPQLEKTPAGSSLGVVTYDWSPGETLTLAPGRWRLWLQATWGSTVETFPRADKSGTWILSVIDRPQP